MGQTVFFSWQDDRSGCRNFIERALEIALDRVNRDLQLEEVDRGEGLTLDRDTKDTAGQPPIVDTIFNKIDSAIAFVPDLTFVGQRHDGRPTPNPNVLIEYGWALKSLSFSRIIAVMNEAYGAPTAESLPFDMKHLRFPITFNLPTNASEELRKKERAKLVQTLEGALRAILKLGKELGGSLSKPYSELVPESGMSRFRPHGFSIGMNDSLRFIEVPREVFLVDGAAIWLRLLPTVDPGRVWSSMELKEAGTSPDFLLNLLIPAYGDLGFVRAEDGFGIYASTREGPTSAITFAFDKGEIWSIDAHLIPSLREHVGTGKFGLPWLDLEQGFKHGIQRFRKFLGKLGIEPPYRFIAGIEGIKGAGLYYSRSSVPAGTCVADLVTHTDEIRADMSAADALKPFFNKIFDRCGLVRPDELDKLGNPQ